MSQPFPRQPPITWSHGKNYHIVAFRNLGDQAFVTLGFSLLWCPCSLIHPVLWSVSMPYCVLFCNPEDCCPPGSSCDESPYSASCTGGWRLFMADAASFNAIEIIFWKEHWCWSLPNLEKGVDSDMVRCVALVSYGQSPCGNMKDGGELPSFLPIHITIFSWMSEVLQPLLSPSRKRSILWTLSFFLSWCHMPFPLCWILRSMFSARANLIN